MKVAVFYDYLQTIGGGERVALTLAEAFHADLYVTDLDPTLPARAGIPGIRPSRSPGYRGGRPSAKTARCVRSGRSRS